MKLLTMKLNSENKVIHPGKLGDCKAINPKGVSYGFTNYYMTKDGQPFIPVVGEFHFSRFSPLHWEEELLKMKAGGVNIIATYVFWNYHEEEEGVFEWGGQRNLRHFIDLCAKVEIPLVLRIGPFCHGEVRNGGIPDWVFRKPIEIRSNDPEYLALARKLYREIAKQVKGTLFQEGGPIIGIQLENEYMHAGAPLDAWGYKTGVFFTAGKEGNKHLDELRRLAEESGMKPMFFTATAWGNAAVPENGTLPMLAGYAYTPWIPDQPPSREYIYRDLHMKPMEPVGYDTLQYPVAYCEMAGGMQVSYTARPNVSPGSVEAMTLVKLASGSNILGYYMYHGGSNPKGKHTYLNEQGLPKITYDYQSPLGEFGRVGESYDRIRSIALMLDAFGGTIAPLGTQLPPGQSEIDPVDTETIRWCVRQQDGSGFLFLNNFQDHVDMMDHHDIRIELDTGKGIAAFPREGTLTMKGGMGAVLPFNMTISNIDIVTATVQPLTKLEIGDVPLVVFQALDHIEPELVLDKRTAAEIHAEGGRVIEAESVWIVKPAVGKEYTIDVRKPNGENVKIVVFSREEALQTYKLELWGQERIVVSSSHLYARDERLVCTSEGVESCQIAVYPPIASKLHSTVGSLKASSLGSFDFYELNVSSYLPSVEIAYLSDKHAVLKIATEWPEQIGDVFLSINYSGDVAAAYLKGELLTDHIHYGEAWPIGLKQFRNELEDESLTLSITPLRQGTVHTFVNQALVERFEGREIAEFNRIEAIPHYEVALSVMPV
ncbi:beta-galactosidase [Neobacillus mesonae]|nr:beta-galactosidase [Neobacillus mesonae]